ncbi:unnamed protein product [Linum trigynum]|uniref:Uncharacterized protein n=1 Tax=Linum trigynum TaxID=586398 RepID=A0AAV2F912_9ROSI
MAIDNKSATTPAYTATVIQIVNRSATSLACTTTAFKSGAVSTLKSSSPLSSLSPSSLPKAVRRPRPRPEGATRCRRGGEKSQRLLRWLSGDFDRSSSSSRPVYGRRQDR